MKVRGISYEKNLFPEEIGLDHTNNFVIYSDYLLTRRAECHGFTHG